MRRSLPLILVSAAVVIAVSILAWQTWLTFAPTPSKSTTRPTARSNDASSPTAPPKVVKRDPTGKIIKPGHDPNPDRLRSLDNPTPVEVRLYGVTKFRAPLHSNAPGRMPPKEGVRQRAGATLPRDPLGYADSLNNADPALLSWLRRWHKLVRSEGALMRTEHVSALQKSKLTAAELFELGRGIKFVYGLNEPAIAFFRAALERSLARLTDTDPTRLTTDEAETLEILRALTVPVWNAEDFPASERLFSMLGRLEPEGSFAKFRALFLQAEAVYRRAMRDEDIEAAEEVVRLVEKMLHDGAIGGYSPSALEEGELVWAVGASMFLAGRYTDALPYLERATTYTSVPFSDEARLHYVLALIETGQLDAARAYLEETSLSPLFRHEALERLNAVSTQN